jgi:hypothetical protein
MVGKSPMRFVVKFEAHRCAWRWRFRTPWHRLWGMLRVKVWVTCRARERVISWNWWGISSWLTDYFRRWKRRMDLYGSTELLLVHNGARHRLAAKRRFYSKRTRRMFGAFSKRSSFRRLEDLIAPKFSWVHQQKWRKFCGNPTSQCQLHLPEPP